MTRKDVQIEVDDRSLKELENVMLNLDQRQMRSAVGKGLRAANKVLRSRLKERSSSRTVARAVRVGSTKTFRTSRKGPPRLPARGVLGSIASGVPSPARVAPERNGRAWFIQYDIERGTRGKAPRNPGEFSDIAIAAGPEIVRAFAAAASEVARG